MINYLDANIVIYLVERHANWGPKAVQRVAALRSAGDAIAISLVGPIIKNDAALLADYNAFITDPAVSVLPVTAGVWERGARIRAAYGFKPLDSLHLAAAVENGCRVFLTNDVLLARFSDITVEILS